MLQGRLTGLVAITLLLAACSGDGDEDELTLTPAVEAADLDDPGDIACAAAAANLRAAVQGHEIELDRLPADEDELIEAGFLRGPNELWDVVDGELVPVDPACEDVPTDVNAIDIMTDPQRPMTADEFYRLLTADAIAEFGGEECAQELAEIYAAGERHVADRGEAPANLDELVERGYLVRPELWVLDGDELAPVDGSGCSAPPPEDS